jgi:hypothetical protein
VLRGGTAIIAKAVQKRNTVLSAKNVDCLLKATVIKAENTALMIATLRRVSARSVAEMNKEYFDCICGYKSAMAQARMMLVKGILTESEYLEIDTMIAEKYGLSSCSLFRDNDLLYKENDGNMLHYEEVTKCRKQ